VKYDRDEVALFIPLSRIQFSALLGVRIFLFSFSFTWHHLQLQIAFIAGRKQKMPGNMAVVSHLSIFGCKCISASETVRGAIVLRLLL